MPRWTSLRLPCEVYLGTSMLPRACKPGENLHWEWADCRHDSCRMLIRGQVNDENLPWMPMWLHDNNQKCPHCATSLPSPADAMALWKQAGIQRPAQARGAPEVTVITQNVSPKARSHWGREKQRFLGKIMDWTYTCILYPPPNFTKTTVNCFFFNIIHEKRENKRRD